MTLAAILSCAMTVAVMTACTNNIDNPSDPIHGDDSGIVGNWFSDISGMTYAKWNRQGRNDGQVAGSRR